MFAGKKLKITAKGLEGGLTQIQDGISLFGTSEKKDVYYNKALLFSYKNTNYSLNC